MSQMYEELDYQQTPLGALILRRRRILKLDRDVVEVILNDEHLMSDMFTASEIALASAISEAVNISDIRCSSFRMTSTTSRSSFRIRRRRRISAPSGVCW